MRIKTLVLAMALILTCAPITLADPDFCAKVNKWKYPRTIFSSVDNNDLKLTITRDHKIPEEAKGTKSAKSGSYYFVKNEQGNSLSVFIDKDYSLNIVLPENLQRPIDAKWINPKLLYIEVWLSPHYGVYWIIDVEQEKVSLSELQNDGVDAWNQCRAKLNK